ncbi:CLUMA_CG011623, isoform A [Clunio marinus]|uniref:CLUMA_CG011623, isoform A n=1 Tax=Clunio marinus TaxID=568069 RepID=A0A1J1IDB2_9DIPT|nr:CLUMA_CG011623, isoform A [Clunio marinus]
MLKSLFKNSSTMFIRISTFVCNIIITSILLVKLSCAGTADIYKNARLGTRIVQTRYGRLQGLVLPLDNFKFLKPVEAFLSVPYATPPTRSNRFYAVANVLCKADGNLPKAVDYQEHHKNKFINQEFILENIFPCNRQN